MLQISMVIFVERFCNDEYRPEIYVMVSYHQLLVNHVEMLKEGAKIRKKLSEED